MSHYDGSRPKPRQDARGTDSGPGAQQVIAFDYSCQQCNRIGKLLTIVLSLVPPRSSRRVAAVAEAAAVAVALVEAVGAVETEVVAKSVAAVELICGTSTRAGTSTR